MNPPGRCKQIPHDQQGAKTAALYIHVPFCRAKCNYCDFYSIPYDRALAEGYLQAVGLELARQAGDLRRPLESVFFGGGTPTCLPPALLSALLSAVAEWLDEKTEFTVEANPTGLDRDVAAILSDAGVNRVSLGAQSFNEKELKVLGRLHGPGDIDLAVEQLRKAGLLNLSLDLIYGIPGQTPDSWRDSLSKALRWPIRHLSCYALSFERDTRLWRERQAGRVEPMPDEVQEGCYNEAVSAAGDAGLAHYEISNFASDGFRCVHNLTYWRNRAYLGIGPGAVSYSDGVRRANTPDVRGYVQALRSGLAAPCNRERLGAREALAETLMLGLRLIEGVDRSAVRDRFVQDPLEAFPVSLERYAQMGALLITPSHLRIARSKLFVADTILADILAEARNFSA